MKRKDNRIPELDGLRVLMIGIVSWYHIWQQSWLFPNLGNGADGGFLGALGIDASLNWLPRTGYAWVDGTVLLSVFLLYLPWAKAKRSGEPLPDARDFYYRRARRIMPGYYFILLCHLLIIAIPWKLYDAILPYVRYPSADLFMWKDLATHLTFTFTRWSDTYQGTYTQLGGAAWTVAVLAQGYMLFPLLGRGMRKHPVLTLGGMLAVCGGFRAWSMLALRDYTMVVNQLVNFLDVYVIGVLSAEVYTCARERQEKKPAGRKQRYLREAGMTVLFLAGLYGLARMLQLQEAAGFEGNNRLQYCQMLYRPAFALCFAALILTAPFALLPLRKLLGNPVTRFLGGISMNYYLIHQTVAVHLKTRLMIPWTDSYLGYRFLVGKEYPNQTGDTVWQHRYAWLCFGVSLVMAVAVTYLVEKPGARLFDRIRKRLRRQDTR